MVFVCENGHEFSNEYKIPCPTCHSNKIVWKAVSSSGTSDQLQSLQKENEELQKQITDLKTENDRLKKKNDKYEQEKKIMIIVVCIAVFIFLLSLILFIAASIKSRQHRSNRDSGESEFVEYMKAESLFVMDEDILYDLEGIFEDSYENSLHQITQENRAVSWIKYDPSSEKEFELS